MAAQVREALQKIETVASVTVDSTATAWLQMRGEATPDRAAITKTLEGLGHGLAGLEKVTRDPPDRAHEILLKGLG